MSRLPPLAKLPLNQRKEVRDEFDAKKEGLEKEITTFFGQEWKISADPLAILPYAKNSFATAYPGAMMFQYFNNALRDMRRYKENHGDEFISEINQLCTAHTMRLDVDLEDKVDCCGGKITEQGEMVILFGTKALGSNMDHPIYETALDKMLNSAPASGNALSFIVRKGIKEDYDPQIKKIADDIAQVLGKAYTLVPNFEGTAATLKDAGKFEKFEDKIGSVTYEYFKGLLKTFTTHKVAGDDMITEAIREETSKNLMEFVVLPGNVFDNCGDGKFDDGVLQIRTDTASFGGNTDAVTHRLLDQL